MKKKEAVYREILYWFMEKKKRSLTQAEIAKTLAISLSTVSHALKPLRKMGAIKVKLRNFDVVDGKKILYYWASTRSPEKDTVYKTRVPEQPVEIEKNMPADAVFGAYSAYKYMFNSMPADYSEIYVYSNNLAEIKKRFPENKGPPNLFVLKKDFDTMTFAHLFVDLWNLKEWYSKEFLKELEEKIYGLLA